TPPPGARARGCRGREAPPAASAQARGDARGRVFAIVQIEADGRGAVILEEVVVAPVEVEVADLVLPGSLRDDVRLLGERLLLVPGPLLAGELPEGVVAVPGKVFAGPEERQARGRCRCGAHGGGDHRAYGEEPQPDYLCHVPPRGVSDDGGARTNLVRVRLERHVGHSTPADRHALVRHDRAWGSEHLHR